MPHVSLWLVTDLFSLQVDETVSDEEKMEDEEDDEGKKKN